MQGFRRFLLSIALCCVATVALSDNVVSQIRCAAAQRMNCVLMSRAPLNYHVMTLSQPWRVVIDLSPLRADPKPRIAFTKTAWLQGLRYQYTASTKTLRLVLSVNQPLQVKAQPTRGNPQVLTLEFHPASIAKSPAVQSPHTPVIRTLPAPAATVHSVSTAAPSAQARPVVVVIDAGHGGKDPGASGPNGIHEKRIVLDIATRLANHINQRPGFVAVMTRRGDYYLTLRQRLSVARRYKPDMFVAIHADAYPNSTAVGASVYALSLRGASSEAARWLADKENESELTGGLDLTTKSGLIKSVLLDLSQSATIRTSLSIGQRIIHVLGHVGHLHHAEVEQAAFVVLKSPDIPSLLVETGFISNPDEERKLLSASYQEQLALALQQGICHYFEQQPPRNTWLAQRG